jgi:hypothetical protein
MTGSALFATIALATLVATGPPELNNENFAHWRDTIRPTQAELRWEQIPWRASFWEGVIDAQKKQQPILIWAMNGHPLACT